MESLQTDRIQMPKRAAKRGELLVVANRLPVREVRRKTGTAWKTSPGGLVSALAPVLHGRGTWVGWSGTASTSSEAFQHEGIRNVPVPLSRGELSKYYEGFCNSTLWPLYHDAVRPPRYSRAWWRTYVDVNRRFAEATAEQARPGDAAWVQDYQLQLVPSMLRELRPDLRIGFFLHIPFPPQELFSQLPWRRQLLEGLLGADVVGFQTGVGARNFVQLAERYTDASVRGERLQVGRRQVRVAAYPISIDVESFRSTATSEEVLEQAARVRARLGKHRKILLGVDRLDYTKGIDVRLRAFQELLRRGTVSADDCVLVQLTVPSREKVLEYVEQKKRIEQLVSEINGEFSNLGNQPVRYFHRNLPMKELVAFYRAADVMLVTPLRDGMNLVCKEYVTTRQDDTGVLVLSEFTGAAHELTEALFVNPHDIEGVVEAIRRALTMPADEMARRMRSMRETVAANDIHHWAGSFLGDLRS